MSNIQQVVLGTSAVVVWGRSTTPNPVQVINLDTVNTATLGFQSNITPASATAIPLGPGASMTFDGTQVIYGCAAAKMTLLLVPGGTAYSPGTLAISGPVTAEISGPVTVEGTIDIGNTPTVEVGNTPSVTISGTPAVTISGTPTVDIGNSPTVEIGSSNTVQIGNTPSVTISGTPTVDVGTVSGSIDIASVAGNVDVSATAGYIAPGLTQQMYALTTQQGVTAGSSWTTPIQAVSNSYLSYDLTYQGWCASQGSGGALTVVVSIVWYADAAGTIPIYRENWYTWLGQNVQPNAVPAYGSGPMHGAYMSLTFSNLGAQTLYINDLYLWGTGRYIPYSDWRQEVPALINAGQTMLSTITSGTAGVNVWQDGAANLLAILEVAGLGNNGIYWQPLPLYSGPVWMRFQTAQAMTKNTVIFSASNLAVNGNISPGTTGGNIGVLWNPGNGAGTEYQTYAVSPRAPMYIVFDAPATGSPTWQFSAYGQQGV